MRPNDYLYRINAWISANWIAKKSVPTEQEIFTLNQELGQEIKRIRRMEDLLEECLSCIDNPALKVVEESCEMLGHPPSTIEGDRCYCGVK